MRLKHLSVDKRRIRQQKIRFIKQRIKQFRAIAQYETRHNIRFFNGWYRPHMLSAPHVMNIIAEARYLFGYVPTTGDRDIWFTIWNTYKRWVQPATRK